MKNKTKKGAASLVVAGIALCGSVAIGVTSAEVSSAFSNWNENDVASYDTGDAYGAVRGGSVWNENDTARHNGTCDVYVDADGDGICDNCGNATCCADGDNACDGTGKKTQHRAHHTEHNDDSYGVHGNGYHRNCL